MCSGYSVHMDTAWTDNFLSTEKFDFEPGNFELFDIKTLCCLLKHSPQVDNKQEKFEVGSATMGNLLYFLIFLLLVIFCQVIKDYWLILFLNILIFQGVLAFIVKTVATL